MSCLPSFQPLMPTEQPQTPSGKIPNELLDDLWFPSAHLLIKNFAWELFSLNYSCLPVPVKGTRLLWAKNPASNLSHVIVSEILMKINSGQIFRYVLCIIQCGKYQHTFSRNAKYKKKSGSFNERMKLSNAITCLMYSTFLCIGSLEIGFETYQVIQLFPWVNLLHPHQ